MNNRKVIIVVAGCLTLVLFIIFLSLKVFIVRDIVITGNKNISEQQIRKALALKEGSSIIYPGLKTLYERLKNYSWIKDAVIRKDLNGKITIHIKESTPVAIATANERAYLIDYEGQVLEDFTEKLKDSKIFLPILKDIDPFTNRDTLQSAVALINFINSKGFVKDKDEIIVKGTHPDNLTVTMNNNMIIIGSGELEAKFAKYRVVNSEIQRRGLNVQYIDLRFPDKVIVKPLE